jgi:pimeloyl-ACP methyl ester carboxylesterase
MGNLIQNEREITIGGDSIHATRHTAGGRRFVVVAPPLFEEDARLRKVLVNLSRYLCNVGYDVVRFDYFGTGFSRGGYEDVSLERTRQNLLDAVEYCRGFDCGRIHLLGVRFGGYLALRALDCTGVNGVVAWEPIVDPAAYIREVLRSEVTTQMLTYGEVRQDRERLIEAVRSEGSIYVEGYQISREFYDQLAGGKVFKPGDSLAGENRVAFIHWQTRREHRRWSSRGIRCRWVDGVHFAYNHIRYMEPRSDELYRHTLEELRRVEEASSSI